MIEIVKVAIVFGILGGIFGIIVAKKKFRTADNFLSYAGLAALVLAIWFW